MLASSQRHGDGDITRIHRRGENARLRLSGADAGAPVNLVNEKAASA